jgi:hypothetical protein
MPNRNWGKGTHGGGGRRNVFAGQIGIKEKKHKRRGRRDGFACMKTGSVKENGW